MTDHELIEEARGYVETGLYNPASVVTRLADALERQLKAHLTVGDLTKLLSRHRMAGQWCEGCKMLVVNAATHHALIIDDEYKKRMITNS